MMNQRDRSASSTHAGIGVLLLSQRATVAREIPKAEARPVCVRPASVRSETRVEGSTLCHLHCMFDDFNLPACDFPHLPSHDLGCCQVGIGRCAPGFPSEAVTLFKFHFCSPCLGEPSVARCYNSVNNLYRPEVSE